MKKQNWLAPLYGLVAFGATATTAFAQILDPSDRANASTGSDMRTAIVNIINYFLLFLGLIAVAFIIYAGIQMATSSGNEQKVKSAQKTITYAVIGLVVVFLAYAIVSWVATMGTQI